MQVCFNGCTIGNFKGMNILVFEECYINYCNTKRVCGEEFKPKKVIYVKGKILSLVTDR